MPSDGPVREALLNYFKQAERFNRQIEAREPVSSDMARETAMAFARVLRTYCLPENWPSLDSAPNEPSPPRSRAMSPAKSRYSAGGIFRRGCYICRGGEPHPLIRRFEPIRVMRWLMSSSAGRA
jgi:hypothetical protein